MKNKRRQAAMTITLLGIIALAAALRLYGVSWGLPDVFEEAIPLREAWKMWGWGPNSGLDLNPHFFNYPSLTIYCQFAGQGVLYLGMRLWGAVDSTIEYAALYAADRTPFMIMGRLINILFGVATVWILYRVCRRIVSASASCFAAFVLAISTFHIQKSQMVEVDIPLTFFCTLALWFIIRIAEVPSWRNHLLAGVTIGLAVSTKYTAALLVIPLLVSHALSGGYSIEKGKSRRGRKSGWVNLAAAGGAVAVTFLVTSPFILLDAPTFLEHLSLERLHMREGHFGVETSGTAFYYLRSLSERTLGWPLLVLSAAGLVYRAVWKRKRPALVLASFAVAYSIAVASWAMKADRYLLPLLPIAMVFAAVAMDDILSIPRIAAARPPLRVIAAAVLLLIAVAPLAAAYPAHMSRYAPDTRTLAREWIEANIPPGAFIVTESYGPELLSAHELLPLDGDIRNAALELMEDRPRYAVQPIPMSQVYPERSEAFYDLRLYRDADLFITSSSVRSRYGREPARFTRQIAFYDTLDAGFSKLREFGAGDRRGPTIAVYKRHERGVPFAFRKAVAGPRPLKPSRPLGTEPLFFKNLGVNYEAFKFYEEAIVCYDLAFMYEMARPTWYTEIILGKTRCLMALGRADEAVSFLHAAAERAPSRTMRERIMGLIQSIRSETGAGGS
jgi:4-amino-4-deoxy-L-arabinose transferase-like glycosyltransferase